MKFSFERAGFGIRSVAGIVDWGIVVIPIGILIYMFTGETNFSWTQGLVFTVPYSMYKTVTPVYWNGQLIGKKIVAIKVTKIDGSKLTLYDMFIREIIGIVGLGFLTLGLSTIVSGFMVLLREDKRAIHDLLASTFVERKKI